MFPTSLATSNLIKKALPSIALKRTGFLRPMSAFQDTCRFGNTQAQKEGVWQTILASLRKMWEWITKPFRWITSWFKHKEKLIIAKPPTSTEAKPQTRQAPDPPPSNAPATEPPPTQPLPAQLRPEGNIPVGYPPKATREADIPEPRKPSISGDTESAPPPRPGTPTRTEAPPPRPHRPAAQRTPASPPGFPPALADTTELLGALKIPYAFKLANHRGWTAELFPTDFTIQAKQAASLALGDLHGSYHKLVETLVAGQFIKMPREAAQKFQALANHADNFSQDGRKLNALYQELKKLVPAMQWTGGNRQLILIGDVLADRGPFDNITLDIVEHLTEGHPERIIRLASNHDHDALTYLTYGVGNIMPKQANSLYKAFELALRNRTTDALRQQYQRYLEQSKLMYYNPETETLYTHAPISQINLRLLIESMKQAGIKNVPAYAELNRKNLPAFTEMANRFYQQGVRESVQKRALNPSIKQLVNGDSGFLWNRNPLQARTDLPLIDQGVRQLVHGHDDGTHHSPFAQIRKDGNYGIFNLDQSVRKEGANHGKSYLYAE